MEDKTRKSIPEKMTSHAEIISAVVYSIAQLGLPPEDTIRFTNLAITCQADFLKLMEASGKFLDKDLQPTIDNISNEAAKNVTLCKYYTQFADSYRLLVEEAKFLRAVSRMSMETKPDDEKLL